MAVEKYSQWAFSALEEEVFQRGLPGRAREFKAVVELRMKEVVDRGHPVVIVIQSLCE